MNIDIKKVLENIVREGGDIKDIKRKVEEKFPGVSVRIEGFKVSNISESDDQNDDGCDANCGCPSCIFRKSLIESTFWKSDKVKNSSKYKLANETIIEKLGDDPKELIGFAVTVKGVIKDNMGKLAEVLHELDMAKLSEQVIMDNLERVFKAQK